MEIVRIICVLVLPIIHMSTCHPVSNGKKCPKLREVDLREMWKKLHNARYEELHWSFSLLPGLNGNTADETSIDTIISQSARSTHLYGPKKCFAKENFSSGDSCPFRYVMHHDRDRIPQNLVHVKCVCERCLNDVTDYNTACLPVYSKTKVLRRGPDCEYNWAYEKVPVACRCRYVRKVVEKMLQMEPFR